MANETISATSADAFSADPPAVLPQPRMGPQLANVRSFPADASQEKPCKSPATDAAATGCTLARRGFESAAQTLEQVPQSPDLEYPQDHIPNAVDGCSQHGSAQLQTAKQFDHNLYHEHRQFTAHFDVRAVSEIGRQVDSTLDDNLRRVGKWASHQAPLDFYTWRQAFVFREPSAMAGPTVPPAGP